MKIKTSPKLRCEYCYFCKKNKKVYVRCKKFTKHKQRKHKK